MAPIELRIDRVTSLLQVIQLVSSRRSVTDTMGAIGLYWAHERRASETDIALIQSLADAVSVSLENVYLYMDLERRVDELARANKAKEEFLMTLSHELRTPLNAILGWSQLLENHSIEGADCDMATAAIARNAEQQARMIDDLLDVTRMLSGKLTLNKTTLDLRTVIGNAIAANRQQAAAKEIHIVSLVPERSLGTVEGDELRLEQIVSNLLSNAIKFSERGQGIEVRLSREGPTAVVKVIDHGEGIDPAQLPQLFEHFNQGDSSTTRRHGGLGLGLAMVRLLAEAHGGHVKAESAGRGQGTTMSVTIPLSTIHDAQPVRSKADTRLLSGVSILAVDDQFDVLILVKKALLIHGAHVVTADMASKAMVELSRTHFDAMVSDISMPEEDGCSLMRRIRARERLTGGRLKAVALTAFADREHEVEALNAGFDAFIGKPLRPQMFAQAIHDLVKGPVPAH